MPQENSSWLSEYSQAYEEAGRDLQTQPWVHISIECKDSSGSLVRLHSYDLPRTVYERRPWVIEWRRSRFVCLYPRSHVQSSYCYYDKRLGRDPTHNQHLRSLASFKAKITIQQRRVNEYISWHKANDLFFDESTDPRLAAIRAKLALARQRYEEAKARMHLKIEELKNLKTPQ